MGVGTKTCDNYAHLTRCSAGFTYAHFQNHIIGADPIVLVGMGRDGSDLSFAAPWEFVEENHLPGRYGLTMEDGKELAAHVTSCSSAACQEASDRLGIVSKIMSRSSPLAGVMIAAQFQPRNGSEPLVLVRENGFGDQIDLLAPIFRGYDKREDFVWPGERRIRFEGYCRVAFEKGGDGIRLTGPHPDRTTTLLQYAHVRKIRQEDRDIWRNPDLYHLENSHPNQEAWDKSHSTAVELREDQELGALVEAIEAQKIGLCRVEKASASHW